VAEFNSQEFELLAEQHYGAIYAIGLAYLGNVEQAEDLAQEVILRGYLLTEANKAPQNFLPWICRVTRNLAIDWIRKGRSSHNVLSGLPIETLEEEPEADMLNARQQASRRQTNAILMEYVNRLPLHLREVVLLHFMEGLNQTEVGQILGISQGAVASRIRTSVKKLRGALEPILREGFSSMRPSRAAIQKRTLAIIAACGVLDATSRSALAMRAAAQFTGKGISIPYSDRILQLRWAATGGLGVVLFIAVTIALINTLWQPRPALPYRRSLPARPASPPSIDGWSAMTTINPLAAQIFHHTVPGGLGVRIHSTAAPAIRRTGWTSSQTHWIPYSAAGASNQVRATFLVSRNAPKNPSAISPGPNVRFRLANRFAVTSMLDVTCFRSRSSSAQNEVYARLAPSTDPQHPSSYSLSYDPIDVPFLQHHGDTEEIAAGFEAYAREPQQDGEIVLHEVQINIGPAANASSNTPIIVLQPGNTDAGNLKAANPGQVTAYAFTRAAKPLEFAGSPAPDRIGELIADCTDWQYSGEVIPAGANLYQEGPQGVTLNATTGTNSRAIAVARNFELLSANKRPVVPAPGSSYVVRFHLLANPATIANSQINLRAGMADFGWSQMLMLAGAHVTDGEKNEIISRQALPGGVCENPDQLKPGEPGGWYTLLFEAPPIAFADNERDEQKLQLSCEVVDTFSNGRLANEEKGQVTIDRIEVFASD
jgi:RNA polymerase sigma-70 factor (ECF subfamily)